MGFYGNITNTSKTNFVFDKIYSNRKAMEDNAATDGVFIGRYVLIEYGTKTPDSFIKAYGPDGDGWYYTSQNQELNTRILFTDKPAEVSDTMIYTGMVIFTTRFETISGTLTEVIDKYLVCKGGLANSKPRFEETDVETDLYFYNKNQDAHYQNSRGYDGTVWTKTSVEENGVAVIKYVNIAELNTVVPTFDIAYDAPTLYPITPHFDTDSNNVYYKLHMQPQWGLRVKNKGSDVAHSDGLEYDSDELVTYKSKRYDPETDTDIDVNETYPGAIYYNEAGFNDEQTHTTNKENLISILPTGKSGQLYNTHDDNYSQSIQNDTQEIVIQLPAIGDTISKIWDIIYGTNPTNHKRYRDFEWKYTNDSDKNGDYNLGGMTRELKTIAGCINSVHDLMGMIIYKGRPNINTANADLIYFDNGKYYRVGVQYDTNRVLTVQDEEYFVEKDDNNIFIPGAAWNNEVKEIPEGVTLVTRNEKRAWIEMDLANELDTIHGWILKLNKYFVDDADGLTRNRDTLQGTLNYLNDIIDKFDKLVPGEFVVVDEYGRMQSAGYTTSQAYTSKNYGKSIEGEDTDNYLTAEDRWIGVDIDTSYENPYITITHNYTPVNPTTTVSDKNDPTDKDGINNNTEDEIYLYTPIIDATGHVVGKNIETVTLPYGYKTIKVTNTADAIVSEAETDININGQSADNTQDTLTLSASNRWIKLDNNDDDVIKFGHKLSDFANGTSANTYYGLTQNEDHTKDSNIKGDLDKDNAFEVPCLKFDEAGHILEARTHTVTLPELFKTVTIGTVSTNTDDTTHTAGTLEADKMTDGFTINPGNKWIQMTADSSNDKFSIQHYVKEFEQSTGTINYNNVATKTFDVQSIGWDEAGHLTTSKKTTYTLPDGFKTITVANSGSSTTTSFGTATNADLVAETLTDTATIDTGNRWLTLVANANDDKVTLYHAKAGTASTSKNLETNNNTTPQFGEKIKVLTAGIDQTGHVKDLDDYEITLPTNSLSEGTTSTTGATGASVITGIVLEDAAAGKFTKTTSDIGALKITGYALGTDAGGLVATDTINSAMSKLQKQINNEVQARQNAINGLDVTTITPDTAGYVFNAISETDGKINATATQAVSNLLLTNYNKPTGTVGAIASNDTLNTAFGKLEKKLSDESARIDAILGGVGAEELNTLKEISDALNDDTNYYTTVNNAIATVQNNLNNTNDNITNNYYTKGYVEANYVLKSTYEELLARVIALEEKMETNHPTETPVTPAEGETI